MTATSFEAVPHLRPPAALGDADIHVWSIPLNVASASLDRSTPLLSADERVRAGRFRFERDRNRYIAARAALRTLLGLYTDCSADQIEFTYAKNGKPFIKRERGGLRPYFNISHSGSIALMAFCMSAEIGVDIEIVRDMPDAENIVRRFFAPEEAAQWMALPAELRTKGFFDCWTRKEAFVKALGDGLSMPLDEFQVEFGPGEPPTVRFRQQNGRRAWSIFDVTPLSEYSAALAIPGAAWDLRCCVASEDWSGA